MARRVSMPTADDLFRKTAEGAEAAARPVRAVADQPDDELDNGPKKPSGRIRHDEKMTVYVTSDELLDIEHTRLMLRRRNGLAVDRGRLVREALALVLADFETNGNDSALVRRLTEE
jgi:hypothetical protein